MAELRPYQFEPEPVAEKKKSHADKLPNKVKRIQLNKKDWCSCGNCMPMDTDEECICCKEYDEVISKILELPKPTPPCIIDHPGFSHVCLSPWVLQTAYFAYRQKYGHYEGTLHERYRYTAYRQLVRFCWGWLGAQVRVILPSCVVFRIRQEFASETYTGYLPPLTPTEAKLDDSPESEDASYSDTSSSDSD